MTANSKNKNAFSYNNHDCTNKNFLNKNFNKTVSYSSNFTNSTFKNTSFIGSKFKYCNLNNTTFEDCFIQGATFRKSKMQNVHFKKSIICASVFDRINLGDCYFHDSIIVSSNVNDKIPKHRLINTDVITNYYPTSDFNELLLQKIEALRSNDFIRRSSTLHRKKGLLNTATISLLIKEFGEEFLLQHIEKVSNEISTEFHTLSYIKLLLKKNQTPDTV